MRSLIVPLVALAAASPASGSTLVTNYQSSGEIAITGDARKNDIGIKLIDGGARWRIVDRLRLVENPTNDPSCVRGDDLNTLLCDRARNRPALVRSLFALGGNDRVTLGHGVRGVDISGDDGRDALRGGNLADRLNGGAGNDKVKGGAGRDRLYGAGGNDLLVANDGAKDGLIECDGRGGGAAGGGDRAIVDARDAPSSSCERTE